jgi:hypothetical protein
MSQEDISPRQYRENADLFYGAAIDFEEALRIIKKRESNK